MLKQLVLKNFMIADSLTIDFEKGLNIITGETGSGKTMLLEALSLISGQKADTTFIKKGHERALVEATFELIIDAKIKEILEPVGVVLSNDLIKISRELSFQKNKILINDHPVFLPTLKNLGSLLLERVSSHTQLLLQDLNYQRELLDASSDYQELAMSHRLLFLEEKQLEEKEAQANEIKKEGAVYQTLWKQIIEEIESADLKEQEEDDLFDQYKTMIASKELESFLKNLAHEVSEAPNSLISRLKKIEKECSKQATLCQKLAPIQSLVVETSALISEASFQIFSLIEENSFLDNQIEEIEKRLNLIKILKKKYGPNLCDIVRYKKEIEKKLEQFFQCEKLLLDLKQSREQTCHKREEVAKKLSIQRTLHAKQLSKKVELHLRDLNMADVEFEIKMTQTQVCEYGIDKVVFTFKTYSEGSFREVHLHASGGELSRIYFAVKVILEMQKKTRVLVFDEIDANIGGMTASFFGRDLKLLSEKKQILCITHFPQVASFANHHLKIQKNKSSISGIDVMVAILDQKGRQEELLRMVGGLSLN